MDEQMNEGLYLCRRIMFRHNLQEHDHVVNAHSTFWVCFFVPITSELYIKGRIGYFRDLPCGAVVKNPPANAGDTGSVAGPGRRQFFTVSG